MTKTLRDPYPPRPRRSDLLTVPARNPIDRLGELLLELLFGR